MKKGVLGWVVAGCTLLVAVLVGRLLIEVGTDEPEVRAIEVGDEIDVAGSGEERGRMSDEEVIEHVERRGEEVLGALEIVRRNQGIPVEDLDAEGRAALDEVRAGLIELHKAGVVDATKLIELTDAETKEAEKASVQRAIDKMKSDLDAILEEAKAEAAKPTFAKCITVTSVGSKPLKDGGKYRYFSWRAEVVNNCAKPFAVQTKVIWTDSEGYELHKSYGDAATALPNQSTVISGTVIVEKSVAARFSNLRAVVTSL